MSDDTMETCGWCDGDGCIWCEDEPEDATCSELEAS